MSQYFPKLYRSFEVNVKVKLDLSSDVKKAELNNATGADISKLAANSDLAGFKAEIVKTNVDKFKTILLDLSKLSNVINNEIVKKTVYDKLVTKVNNTHTSIFVLRTKYDTDKTQIYKRKFLILVGLLKNRL